MKLSNIFEKVFLYITSSQSHLVFFFASLIAVGCGIAAFFVGIVALNIAMACFAVALIASLAESMQSRVEFNKRIYEMQAEHYKQYLQSGVQSPDGIPTAFSPDEYDYIKREKRNFVFAIVIKTALILMIFVMLFGQ
ncbi:MAG: hypothetical protein LBQ05_01180 [Christensenellaceae bacterium]|jgi:hypothetical protein|nr:hypothetical protein [Christensenellaceae bacterium]